MEISERSGIPIEDVDFAARYGDRWWIGGSNGSMNIRCEYLDWDAIAAAIDDLSGRTRRQTKLKTMRRKAGGGKKNIAINSKSQRF